MKKKNICLLFLAVTGGAALSACAAGYETSQTRTQISMPTDCTGLHVKSAVWRYTDDNGIPVFTQGSCAYGEMNGKFLYYMAGEIVAESRFSRGVENRTWCYQNEKKIEMRLDKCLSVNSSAKAAKARKNVSVIP